MNRDITWIDQCITQFDIALRAICPPEKRQSERANPADPLNEVVLSANERTHTAGLMRVNHTGEVCAQALYQGQALTACLPNVREQMNHAAQEEIDHLAWCESRLRELQSGPSILNPLWYGGAFMIGLLAGAMGDGWSLGFLAETEHQVTAHLQSHLALLSQQDVKTQAILTQMAHDENQHAKSATDAGAYALPFVIRQGMRFASKCMTTLSYYF